MSLPTSLHAYPQEIDAFDRAVASERGIRFAFPDEGSAYRFRSRLHQARALQRKASTLVLDPGHPLYGHSEWDVFTCLLRTDGVRWWVYIRKIESIDAHFEELTEETYDPPRIERQPILLPSAPVKAYRR